MTTPRVICGDALEGLRGLEPESVQLFCTSPPYAQGKEYEIGLDYDGLWALIAGVAEAALPACKPSGFFFVNFGETTKYQRPISALYGTVFAEAGWLIHSHRIWLKPLGACGFPYTCVGWTIPVAEYECIWTFRKPPNDKEPHRDDLSYRGAWGPFNETMKSNGHPCAYPVALPAAAIRVWTDPGDLVCDPFCGSGTTGVACVNLNRRFVGIDQDEDYCAKARRRINAAQPPLSFSTSPTLPPQEDPHAATLDA